jgi:hypothetical protein
MALPVRYERDLNMKRMNKFCYFLSALFLVNNAAGCSNSGKRYIADYKMEWQFKNELERRMAKLAGAFMKYVAVNKNTFPPMKSSSQFIDSLRPHLAEAKEEVFYHPKTGDVFLPNRNLSSATYQKNSAGDTRILVGICPGDKDGPSGVLYFDATTSTMVFNPIYPSPKLESLKKGVE